MEIGYSLDDTDKNVKYCKSLNGIDYIGEYYVLFDIPSNYFYKADTEVFAYAIKKDLLIDVLKKYPYLNEKLRTNAFRRNFYEFRKIIDAKFNSDIKIFNSLNKNMQIVKNEKFNVLNFLF